MVESVSQEGPNDKHQDGVELITKPRNNFSSNALRQVVPGVNLKKKRESLTMSMISLKKRAPVSKESTNSGKVAFPKIDDLNKTEGDTTKSKGAVCIIKSQISKVSPKLGESLMESVRENGGDGLA
jgi:hypothetical protein